MSIMGLLSKSRKASGDVLYNDEVKPQLAEKDGYEIVDIKFDSLKGQGITGTAEGFHTLIMYR